MRIRLNYLVSLLVSVPILGLLAFALLIWHHNQLVENLGGQRALLLEIQHEMHGLQVLMIEDPSLEQPRIRRQWQMVTTRLRADLDQVEQAACRAMVGHSLDSAEALLADAHERHISDPVRARLAHEEVVYHVRAIGGAIRQHANEIQGRHREAIDGMRARVVIGLIVLLVGLPIMTWAGLMVLHRDIDKLKAGILGTDLVAMRRMEHLRVRELDAVGNAFARQIEDLAKTTAKRDELDREILARQEVEEHLQRSNADLEQFAYVASHDLQEPLRMVASYTQLLGDRYRGRLDDDADTFINYAVEGAKRMQALISDLLMYSRVNTRGGDFVACPLEEILAIVRMNVQSMCEERGVLLTHDPLPTIVADKTQMLQLIQNTVVNAIKFTPHHPPQIHIWVEEEDRYWCIHIRDNGIGIEPQHKERIFEVFQRLNPRDRFAGTGIGLAVCKRVVQRHQGSISVESIPDQGSTFTYTIAKGLPHPAPTKEHACPT